MISQLEEKRSNQTENKAQVDVIKQPPEISKIKITGEENELQSSNNPLKKKQKRERKREMNFDQKNESPLKKKKISDNNQSMKFNKKEERSQTSNDKIPNNIEYFSSKLKELKQLARSNKNERYIPIFHISL